MAEMAGCPPEVHVSHHNWCWKAADKYRIYFLPSHPTPHPTSRLVLTNPTYHTHFGLRLRSFVTLSFCHPFPFPVSWLDINPQDTWKPCMNNGGDFIILSLYMTSLSSFPHSLSNNGNVHFGLCYASEILDLSVKASSITLIQIIFKLEVSFSFFKLQN